MKKLIGLFISILVIIYILISYMVYVDRDYYNDMVSMIDKNTDIEEIGYINLYNNYYIVLNEKKIYVLSDKYEIILEKDLSLIHKNDKNYNIIYMDDKLMYFNEKYEDKKLVYEYYDINTYELDRRVFVGG